MIVELTQAQRTELARRIEAEVYRQYRNNKKAAYTVAEVNSATFQRAVDGLSIKPHSLAAIVGALWPATGGDWRNLDPPLEAAPATSARQAILDDPDLDDDTRAALLALYDSRRPPPPPPQQRHRSA